jgi:hypothetical protein
LDPPLKYFAGAIPDLRAGCAFIRSTGDGLLSRPSLTLSYRRLPSAAWFEDSTFHTYRINKREKLYKRDKNRE